MVTIIPRAEERLQIRPMADVRREERAPNTGGAVAEAQQRLGGAVQREALSFGELAIQKQEQVDRIELAKIKALRDSELQTVLQEEERNPDYEGMNGRITSRMKKYDDDLRKGVNGRLLKYVDPMIETEGAKLVPVLQGMYLKKQDDHASATALEAINQFIQNSDWASADATVDGMSWMDESQRAKLKIDIANKRQAYELTVNARKLYDDTGGDYGKAMAWIADNVAEGDRKDFTREFQAHFSDMESVKRATYQKTRDEISKAYLKPGGLKGVNLQALVDAGKLDADGAMTWQDRLRADQERRAAAADRAANKVFRDAYKSDQLFKLSLRGKPPVVQELLSYEHEYGKSASYFIKNYNDAAAKIQNGQFTLDDLAGLKAYAKVIPTHLDDLERKMRERASSPEAFAIKMSYDSTLGKMMDDNGIKDIGTRTKVQDRFNFEHSEALRKEGRQMSNEAAVKVMQGLLAPEVVGKEMTWRGRADKTVRRYEIPPNAEKGTDGRWYVPGADKKFHQLIFTDKGVEASTYHAVDTVPR